MSVHVEHHAMDVGDDLRLHVELSGRGPPVVLLHGFTGSTTTWSPLVSSLRDEFTTVAVDLPGHGRSSAPREARRYGLTRLADDLATVLDNVHLPRVVLLGYSLGGRAALHFALRHPARLAALVLESSSPGIQNGTERAARAEADDELAEAIERDGTEAFTDRWERLPLWASQAGLPPATVAALRAQRLANDAQGLANSLRGTGQGSNPDVSKQLSQLAHPALLIAGALDEKYATAARRMAATMPLARAAIVEQAGHAVHLERPVEFATLVREFLAEVPSTADRWT